jgi:8-oxo-dGTP diphosphatase
MARAPVLAAGGIVQRQEATPLIAVVRLRKRNEWVLPKGKLDDGETPRAAAEREVMEETGHDVAVHDFLGTLVYESGGRFKVVHYWRMEASGEQAYDLMHDVKAVDWLPLDAAVERLSRAYERAFLSNVGPLALEAAALAEIARRPKANQPAFEKRRSRRAIAPAPSFAPALPQPELISPKIESNEPSPSVSDAAKAETPALAAEVELVAFAEADSAPAPAEPPCDSNDNAVTARTRRGNVMQRLRDWLRHAGVDLSDS